MGISSHKYHNLSKEKEAIKKTLETARHENLDFTTQTTRKSVHSIHNSQLYTPIHKGSEMKASLLLFVTSIQSFPSLTTGQDFLHSWLHFFGLHLEEFTMAIRVRCSSSLPPAGLFPFFLGGIFVNFLLYSKTLFDCIVVHWTMSNNSITVANGRSRSTDGSKRQSVVDVSFDGSCGWRRNVRPRPMERCNEIQGMLPPLVEVANNVWNTEANPQMHLVKTHCADSL